MLVLSRRLGERILVPHCDLAVTVVAVEGNTVKLGITAPTKSACTARSSGTRSARKVKSNRRVDLTTFPSSRTTRVLPVGGYMSPGGGASAAFKARFFSISRHVGHETAAC